MKLLTVVVILQMAGVGCNCLSLREALHQIKDEASEGRVFGEIAACPQQLTVRFLDSDGNALPVGQIKEGYSNVYFLRIGQGWGENTVEYKLLNRRNLSFLLTPD